MLSDLHIIIINIMSPFCVDGRFSKIQLPTCIHINDHSRGTINDHIACIYNVYRWKVTEVDQLFTFKLTH